MDTTIKLCRICRQVKPVNEFPSCPTTRDRFRSECKGCTKVREHARYLKNLEKRKQQSRAWKAANPERYKENYRRYYRDNKEKIWERVKEWVKKNPERRAVLALNSLHGVNLEPTRPRPLVCEVCGSAPGKKALALDHCHSTGLFRGWLCGRCNTAIGHAKDDPDLLIKLANYLKAFNGSRSNL